MRSRVFAAAAVILGGAAAIQTIQFGGGLTALLAAPAAAAEEESAEARTAATENTALPAPEAGQSFPEQIGASADEYRILISLQQRRRELEQWQAEIETRAQVVESAEARVEERLAELRAVREEISVLLGNLDEQEAARVTALVATYEKMDSDDAARILAGLETDTSLLVMARMKDQNRADILGEMGTEDARRITELLAARANLRAVVGEEAEAASVEEAAQAGTTASAEGAGATNET